MAILADKRGPEPSLQVGLSVEEPQVGARVFRSVAELAEIRDIWTAWQSHPDLDPDFYQMILRTWPHVLRPHVVVLYRDNRPEAMLIGRVEETRLDFRVGYLTLARAKARIMVFPYRGLLGDQSAGSIELLLDSVIRSLRQGEADVAVLSWLDADTLSYQLARRFPGFLIRDYFPSPQPHWAMELSDVVDSDVVDKVYEGLSRDHRWELRRKAKKFNADFPGQLRIEQISQVSQLESLMDDAEEIAEKTYQRGLGVGFARTPAMRERLHLEAEKGWLRAFLLYVADRPCAFWIGRLYRGTFLSDYLSFDPSYGKYSPGTYVLVKAIEHLCGNGAKEIDFGFGEGRYKERFGNRRTLEASVHVYAPTGKGVTLNLLRTATLLVDRTARMILKRTNLLSRLKKSWRSRVAQSESQPGNRE